MTKKIHLLTGCSALAVAGIAFVALPTVTQAEMATAPAVKQTTEADPLLLLGLRGRLGGMAIEIGDEDVSLGTDDGEFPIDTVDGCTECSEPPYTDPEPVVEPTPPAKNYDPKEPVVATTTQTNQLVNSLELTRNTCDLYNRVERVDCLREEYHRIVQRLPNDGEYGAMKKELAGAVAELDAIVTANAAPTPPVRRTVEVNGKRRTSNQAIRAIADNRIDAANAAAAAVLDKLSTRLLRSASSAGAQAIHYQRAAQAIDSAKVLLRSA